MRRGKGRGGRVTMRDAVNGIDKLDRFYDSTNADLSILKVGSHR